MKIVQMPRHSTSEINAIVLQEGNLRMDNVTKEVRVGDGFTAGGRRLLHLEQLNGLFIRKDEGLGPEVGFPESGIGFMVRLNDGTYIVRILEQATGILLDNGDGASDNAVIGIDQTWLDDTWFAAKLGSTANIWANAADKILQIQETWAAASHQTLTFGSTTAINLANGFNFKLALTGNTILGNPTGIARVQSGEIEITADASDRAVTLGANWKVGSSGSPFTIPAGKKASLIYGINSSGAPNAYSAVIFG